MNMISVKNLNKSFGAVAVLENINFDISQGEIIGFLGQNGAGKTTLMRILTTYLEPSAGEVLIGANNVCLNPSEVRKIIGYLPENPPLYPALTVREYLRFAARLRDVSAKRLNAEVDRVVSMCDLKDVVHKSIGILSKGFKQRVGIAQAIVHDPQVLILDEPTSGLDPIQNLSVRKLIKDLEHKRTVILSTHILSEIEQIAKRVLVIKKGKIAADKQLTQWMVSSPGKNLEELFVQTVGGDNHE